MVILVAACGGSAESSTPDIEATIRAGIEAAAAAQPTATTLPTPTPDIEATVQAQVQATVEAIPTPTAVPPTPVPPTPVPPTPVPPTPVPPTPVPPTPVPSTPVPPTPTPTPGFSLSSMVAAVRPAVVRIETDNSTGSGVIFEVGQTNRSALVLTNYHVIEGASSITVTVNDSVRHSGRFRVLMR